MSSLYHNYWNGINESTKTFIFHGINIYNCSYWWGEEWGEERGREGRKEREQGGKQRVDKRRLVVWCDPLILTCLYELSFRCSVPATIKTTSSTWQYSSILVHSITTSVTSERVYENNNTPLSMGGANHSSTHNKQLKNKQEVGKLFPGQGGSSGTSGRCSQRHGGRPQLTSVSEVRQRLRALKLGLRLRVGPRRPWGGAHGGGGGGAGGRRRPRQPLPEGVTAGKSTR